MLQLYIDEVIWNEWCNHPHFGVWLVFKSRVIHGYTMQRKDNLQIIISSMLTIRPRWNLQYIQHSPSERGRLKMRTKRPELAGRPGGRSADQGKQWCCERPGDICWPVPTWVHLHTLRPWASRWREMARGKAGGKNGAWSITEGPKKPNKPNKLSDPCDTCDTWIPFKSF